MSLKPYERSLSSLLLIQSTFFAPLSRRNFTFQSMEAHFVDLISRHMKMPNLLVKPSTDSRASQLPSADTQSLSALLEMNLFKYFMHSVARRAGPEKTFRMQRIICSLANDSHLASDMQMLFWHRAKWSKNSAKSALNCACSRQQTFFLSEALFNGLFLLLAIRAIFWEFQLIRRQVNCLPSPGATRRTVNTTAASIGPGESAPQLYSGKIIVRHLKSPVRRKAFRHSRASQFCCHLARAMRTDKPAAI